MNILRKIASDAIKRNKNTPKIDKEIAKLSRARKHYKLQSEWHRLMYSLTLRKEIIDGQHTD